MAIIDGKIRRARFGKLRLDEISSVDRPAQVGATATILKRAGGLPAPASGSILATAVAKYISDDDGAHTFAEVLQANHFDEKIWPMTNALSQAIRSTMGDRALDQAAKESKVTQSVDEFLAAVRDISPTAEKRLANLISKGSETMKTVEQLEAEVTALKGQLATASAEVATLKAAVMTAEEKAKMAEDEKEKAAKALVEATDQVIKVGETEIRKSVVGDAQFSVAKALADDRDLARIEKRVDAEFDAVVGTVAQKALVLKAVAAMPEDTAKAFEAIMTSAQKMAAAAFDTFGHAGGPISDDVRKAAGDFDGKVAEIQKRDGSTKAQAMSKARREFPALFEAANPDAQAA